MKKRHKQPSAIAASVPSLPITAAFKKHRDENLREIMSGADIAERHVLDAFGELAATNLKALIPENRGVIARIAFQRLFDGETVEDVKVWLAIKVRDQRLALEKDAKTVLGLQAGRKRGGANSVTNRQAPWQAWRDWICAHASVRDPTEVSSDLRRSVVDVICFRGGARNSRPTLDASVPSTLPILRGRTGKVPSDDSIRRNLFGSRAK
jgi:hypothetical protein